MSKLNGSVRASLDGGLISIQLYSTPHPSPSNQICGVLFFLVSWVSSLPIYLFVFFILDSLSRRHGCGSRATALALDLPRCDVWLPTYQFASSSSSSFFFFFKFFLYLIYAETSQFAPILVETGAKMANTV